MGGGELVSCTDATTPTGERGTKLGAEVFWEARVVAQTLDARAKMANTLKASIANIGLWWVIALSAEETLLTGTTTFYTRLAGRSILFCSIESHSTLDVTNSIE